MRLQTFFAGVAAVSRAGEIVLHCGAWPGPRAAAAGPRKRPVTSCRLDALPEAQTVAVAVVHLEVAAAIGLVERAAHDRHPLGLELRMQRVGVVDPEVGVP